MAKRGEAEEENSAAAGRKEGRLRDEGKEERMGVDTDVGWADDGLMGHLSRGPNARPVDDKEAKKTGRRKHRQWSKPAIKPL